MPKQSYVTPEMRETVAAIDQANAIPEIAPHMQRVYTEMQRRHWSRARLSRAVGCSRNHINEVLYGRRPLSVRVATGLCRAFGMNPVALFAPGAIDRTAVDPADEVDGG